MLPLLFGEAAAQMPAMTNKEFANAAWALAKLSPPRPRRALRPPAAFVERLWQQAHLRSGRLAPGEAARLIHAVGRLGLDAPPRWLAGELAASQRMLQSARPEDVVATLVSLARMGRAPGREWLEAFESAGAGGRLAEFSLQELVNTLWALSALRHAPGLPWQRAAAAALRGACGEACGQGGPLGAAAAAALLDEAGLLPVLKDALDEAAAAEGAGGDGRAGAEGGGGAEGGECPLSFGFELPLGAA